MLLPMLLASAALATPDGTRLDPGESCYAIVMSTPTGEKDVGSTWQSLAPDVVSGKKVWRIVVHQRLTDGRFDMRDEFVLDRMTMLPVSLSTTFKGKPHASLAYGGDRVTGSHVDRSGAVLTVDQPLERPVWEGDLYGVTFAALPLTLNARFELPYFQYDKGFGTFTVAVVGEETMTTPQGPVPAWVLDAGASPESRMEIQSREAWWA